ncbi:MAG: hypothetical protein II008_20690 [Oscillospiraceae bacterium]|nr:hypothetical protein [Oscillospiraceae bacterium]
MATRSLKARVELDGEKQYKQALSELNQGNKVLASEMKKLQAEYKNNASSSEFLTKKSELLERTLLQQKDKVATLREALKNAAEQYGEADKRTQDWQIKLNNAEAAQYDLEHQLEETNQEIAKQGEAVDKESGEMVSLGDAVDQVAGKLGIKIPDGAKKALDGMKGLSAGSVAAMGAIAVAVAATIKAIEKLNEITLDAAKQADDLITKSMQSNVSTTMLQQWEYAAAYIDVPVDTITGALSKVTKAAGSGSDAFAKLGVATRDQSGQLRSSTDIFFDALRALSEYGNETERDAVAQELFGKSASELNPLILQLDEAERRYNEALEDGYVLNEGQVKILGEVDDAHEHYTQTVQKNKDLIAAQWAPAVKEGYELLTKMLDKAGKMLIDSKLVENFAGLVQSTLGLIDACSDLFGLMPSWLNPINMLSTQLKGLAAIMATIADTANLISGLMPWNWGSGKATTALGWNMSKGQMSNLQQLKYGNSGWEWNEELGAWNAGGSQNWRGGLTWVGESGPELVALPQGSRIYNAQESRAAASPTVVATDLSQIEQLLGDVLSALRDKRVIGRMA